MTLLSVHILLNQVDGLKCYTCRHGHHIKYKMSQKDVYTHGHIEYLLTDYCLDGI